MMKSFNCVRAPIVAVIFFLPWLTTATSGAPAHQHRDEECGLDGNSDLYGLGIRAGIYMQWISSFIMYGWYPEGKEGLTESYIIFLFAIMVVLIAQTAQAAPVYAVEILLLTYFIFGGALAVTSVGVRRRNWERLKRNGRFRALSVTLILTAAAIYCSWFWIHGLNNAGNFLPTPCGTYVFFFAKVPFFNEHLIRFFAAISVIAAVGWGPIILASGLSVILGSFSADDVSEIDPKLANSQYFSLILSIMASIYSVIAIELTLRWNSVRDVYTIKTTGQLLPFVIGLVALAKCLYKSILDHVHQRRNDRPPVKDEDHDLDEVRLISEPGVRPFGDRG